MEGSRTGQAPHARAIVTAAEAGLGCLEATNGGAERARRFVLLFPHDTCPLTVCVVEMAQLFRSRSSSVLAASVLKRWREVLQSHQNAQAFAVHYHRAQLQYRMLLTWRLQLRAKLRLVKQAKAAQKYLVMRRCFRAWAAKVQEKKRLRKLKQFELRVAKRYFEGECIRTMARCEDTERYCRVAPTGARGACGQTHPSTGRVGRLHPDITVLHNSDSISAHHDKFADALDHSRRRPQAERA